MYEYPHCNSRSVSLLKKANADVISPGQCKECSQKYGIQVSDVFRVWGAVILSVGAGYLIGQLHRGKFFGLAVMLAGLFFALWSAHRARLYRIDEIKVPPWLRPFIETANDFAVGVKMNRYPSFERLGTFRTLGLSSAAVCLAIILAATQTGTSTLSMKMAVISAGAALPMWAAYGLLFEIYMLIGRSSYPHLRNSAGARLLNKLQLWGGIAMIYAIACVLWYLSPEAAIVFGVTCLLAIAVGMQFYADLADWLAANSRPEPDDQTQRASEEADA